jgi:hypothetical protein
MLYAVRHTSNCHKQLNLGPSAYCKLQFTPAPNFYSIPFESLTEFSNQFALARALYVSCMASPAQITASRANGALSHGPATSEGKAISSRNALKTGMYAEALIIPGEDPADFERLAAEYHDNYQPADPAEEGLLNQAIRAEWMQRRFIRIEAAVINYRMSTHPNPDVALGAAYDDDHKHGNTLHRLSRRREAALREWREALQILEKRQAIRRAREAEARLEAEMEEEFHPQVVERKIPSAPAGSFRTAPAAPARRPADTPANLALRL